MAKSNKFGTFGGVFTPSILTILGVIMYMRLPMIIGNAGLYGSLGIILVAHLISVTTGLSVSSIATDKKVQAGGTYYIISRSLGLPIGGTLGLALFVGLSFSVSLYLIGFSESFLNYWGLDVSINTIRLTGTAILLLVTILTFISTSLALKTQYFIMAAIFLSLISIFFGKHSFEPSAPALSDTTSAIPLMVLFGIFFPAVTGFEAGVSMSGDLKDPKSSIPKGTISAILIGLIVYIGLAFFFSYTVDKNVLANDPKVLFKIALIPQLVIAGIWGATLSSALGSILAAPRILQATAADRITHRFFAKGTKATNEPRNALLLTFVIAETGILIGELNVIARIVSVFFITTYGFLNLSCAFERIASADFRPAFKTPAWISLLGSMACMLVMIQLDFMAMIGATIILGTIYLYLKRKELTLQTGDAWSGVWASLVKSGLWKLRTNRLQSRNWRPNIIMFSGDENSRPHMIDLGKDISGRLGILTGFELEKSGEEILPKKKDIINPDTKSTGFFMNHHTCKDIYAGMDEIMRIYGFSGIEPNTILMGWSTNKNNKQAFTGFIKKLEKNNFNSIFMNYNPAKGFGNRKTIDIWWSGWGQNLTFSINLIRHLTSSGNWKDSVIRLFIVTDDFAITEIIYKSVRNILEQYRIDMEIKVINNSVNKFQKNEIIQKESANTDLTIVGIPDKKYQHIETTYAEVCDLISNIGTTLFINASNTFEAYDLLHEERPRQKHVSVRDHELSLPALGPSTYQLINEEVQKIDARGIEILELFHNKAIAPFFRENLEVVNELERLYNISFSGFKRLSGLKETYRKEKQLFKIRNDLNFKTESLLENLLTEKLKIQQDILSASIEWYLKKLEDEIVLYPKKLKVPYRKESFQIQKSDSFGLKWRKVRKKILHPFTKTILKEKIKYRALIRYYLRDNRLQYLDSYLKDFNQSSLLFISGIKGLFISIENEMDLLSKSLSTGNAENKEIHEIINSFLEKINKLRQDITANSEFYHNSLLSDYRKNLQLLIYDFEKINCDKLVAKKRRKSSYYRSLKINLLDFPQGWFENTFHYSNKIYLDLIVLSLKNKIKDETGEFIQRLKLRINSELLIKIRQFLSEIKKIRTRPGDFHKIKPELTINGDFLRPDEDFKHFSDAIDKMTEGFPETIDVSEIKISDSKELQNELKTITEVPVQQIIKHFINSIFLGDVEEYLKNLNEDIRKITFKTKDHVSYMYFELENLDADLEDIDAGVQKILEEIKQEIIPEENNAIKIYEEIENEILHCFDHAFEPLSSMKILDSSHQLSHFIREYKGKKTLGRIESWYQFLKAFIKNKTVRLLYSQSEGVLLAKKITEGENQQSASEQILDFVTQVSPDSTVYDKIPAYYKNLFSGRSSISEDFWIERKVEEEQFHRAFNHYHTGYKGGIMIVGEKNSGKTAFCRHITKKYFPNEKIYHVFPPLFGSAKPEDFNKALNEVTGLSGKTFEVFERLPNDIAMVFHDMELWWEMSDSGFDTFQLILDTIKEYSEKCLFVLNMNQYTYNRINAIHDIENNFIGVIFCRPFDSEELKELIMRRHKSSGMKIHLGKKNEEQLSDIRTAGLFNKLFNYSGGNPGLSLFTWLTQIKRVTDERFTIEPPTTPGMGIFESLNDDWQVVLIQLIYHKRMDLNKLKNVLQIDESEIEKIVNTLLMTGLVKEKTKGLYVINNYTDRFLAEYFHEHELI
jgi:amino acid transporter